MSTSTQAPALWRSTGTGGDPGMQEPQARPPGGAQGVGQAPSPALAPRSEGTFAQFSRTL